MSISKADALHTASLSMHFSMRFSSTGLMFKGPLFFVVFFLQIEGRWPGDFSIPWRNTTPNPRQAHGAAITGL